MATPESRCRPWMAIDRKGPLRRFRCSCGATGEWYDTETQVWANVLAFTEWRVHLVDCPDWEEGAEDTND